MNCFQNIKQLKKTEKALGLKFRNPTLLISALAHPSFRHETPTSGLDDFDRLEFFGDSVLNYTICCKLYSKFPKASEGLLSRLRSILVSRKILARISKDFGLHRLIFLGKNLATQTLDTKAKILADSFEALIAAVYFDQDLDAAKNFILKHFKTYFSVSRLFRLDPNPKSSLQEISQKFWQKLPVYSHAPLKTGVRVTVAVGKSRKASAVGRNHRDGEEKAARLLIRKIRQEPTPSRRKRVSSGKKVRKLF